MTTNPTPTRPEPTTPTREDAPRYVLAELQTDASMDYLRAENSRTDTARQGTDVLSRTQTTGAGIRSLPSVSLAQAAFNAWCSSEGSLVSQDALQAAWNDCNESTKASWDRVARVLEQHLTSEPAASVPVTRADVHKLCCITAAVTNDDAAWDKAIDEFMSLLQSAAVPASPADIEE